MITNAQALCRESDSIEHILSMAQDAGYRTTPVFQGGKTRPYGKGQNYPNPSAYTSAVAVGLVLDDALLLDYDANKGTPMSITELEVLLGQPLREPIQSNTEGNSLHWLFSRADHSDLKASADNWHEFIDLKTGNQLMHLKPGKTIKDNQIPSVTDLPGAPQVLLTALEKPVDTNTLTVPGGDTDQINGCLEVLSPDCDYGDWLKVGMAIHHETDGTGLKLWKTWSANSEKYKPGEMKSKWDSFSGSTNPVTIKSLIKLAESKGYVVPGCESDFDDISDQVFDPVPNKHDDLFDRTYLILSAGAPKYFDTKTKCLYGETSFDRMLGGNTFKKKIGQGKARSIPPHKFLTDNVQRCKRATGVGWHPTDCDTFKWNGEDYVNTYKPPHLTPQAGDVSDYLTLVDHIYGEQAGLFLDHIAFSLQRPAEKILWQILVQGKPRTGKSMTVLPLQTIWGNAYSGLKPTDLDSGWGDVWFAKKTIIVEEVHRPGDRSFFNSIKAKLANTEVEYLNIKGQGYRLQSNLYSMYLFSNHSDALSFKSDEDKLMVIDGPNTKLEPAFYKRLGEYLTSEEGASQVYHYLLNRDVSQFSYGALPKEAKTDAMRRMVVNSRPDYQRHLVEQMEDQVGVFAGPIVTLAAIKQDLNQAGYSKFGDRGIAEALTEGGYSKYKGQKKGVGCVRFWSNQSDVALMTSRELFDHYHGARTSLVDDFD